MPPTKTAAITIPVTISRASLDYAGEAKESILDFLRLIEQYEPKAIGGKLPDNGFISGEQ